MSNFLPLVKKEYEFEGDTIATEFSRLTRAQMLSVSPYIPEVKNGKAAAQSSEDSMRFMDKAIDALKENMKVFTGLKDGDGNVLEFAAVADQSYFTTLLAQIAGDLMSESMVKEKKLKK